MDFGTSTIGLALDETLDQDNSISIKKAHPKANKYLKTVVESASPAQLIVLLYDGAIQWLNMAKKEIQKNQVERPPNWSDFSHQTRMAVSIIDHLQDVLDHKAMPELSEKLDAMYDFMKENIFKAGMTKSEAELDTTIKFLKELKSHWQEGIKAVA